MSKAERVARGRAAAMGIVVHGGELPERPDPDVIYMGRRPSMRDPIEVELEAPHGQRLSATETHYAVYSQHAGETRVAVWRAIAEDLDAGFEPCDGCEVCEVAS